MYKMNMEKWEK